MSGHKPSEWCPMVPDVFELWMEYKSWNFRFNFFFIMQYWLKRELEISRSLPSNEALSYQFILATTALHLIQAWAFYGIRILCLGDGKQWPFTALSLHSSSLSEIASIGHELSYLVYSALGPKHLTLGLQSWNPLQIDFPFV